MAELVRRTMKDVLDTRSRQLRDLRISVTDRCNFRCTYCMPKEIFGREFVFLSRAQLLTLEEIARLARAFAREGVSKVRLTGGEPLLRRDLEQLVAMLAAIDGISDVALTTNGSALATRAASLKASGLSRVTVSLDALDDRTFAAMNDVDFQVARVLAGIDAAAAAELTPVKINMVVKRGVNDDRVVEMAERFRGTGHILRFIEYMDVGTTNGWRMDDVVQQPRSRRGSTHTGVSNRFSPNTLGRSPTDTATETMAARSGSSPRLPNPSAARCTRARLSADGKLYTCLFAAHGHDLRALLRNDDPTDEELSSTCAPHGHAAPTATQTSATPKPSSGQRSRCPTSAANTGASKSWKVARVEPLVPAPPGSAAFLGQPHPGGRDGDRQPVAISGQVQIECRQSPPPPGCHCTRQGCFHSPALICQLAPPSWLSSRTPGLPPRGGFRRPRHGR